MKLKTLKIFLLMTLLSACSTNTPAEFCLVYTKPTMKSPEIAALLEKKERNYVDAVNANKGIYKKICENK